MGSISAGTVVARFGADTSQFQAGIRRVQSDLNDTGGAFESLGYRSARSLLRVTSGIGEATAAISSGSVHAATAIDMLAFHVAHAAELTAESAGGMKAALVGVGALLGELSLVAGAVIGGWKLGQLVSDVTGLSAAAAKAGPPLQEMAAALATDGVGLMVASGRFETAREQAVHLTQQLRLAVPEWLANATETKATAVRILEYTDALIALHPKQVTTQSDVSALTTELAAQGAALDKLYQEGSKVGIGLALDAEETKRHAAAVAADNKMLFDEARATREVAASHLNEHVPALVQVQIALAAGAAQMRALGEDTMKTYGILSQGGAAEAMATMQEKVRAVALAGGDAGQVLQKMGPDILKSVEAAKQMGLAVPPLMDDMALAVKSGNDLWLGDIMAGLKKTPDAAKEAAEANVRVFDGMGHDLEGTVSGGFGRGAEKGIAFAKQQFDAWRVDVETKGLTIPVRYVYPNGEPQRTGGAV